MSRPRRSAADMYESLAVQLADANAEGRLELRLEKLQERISECDRAGGRDADRAPNEDLESFDAIASSFRSPKDIDELIDSILI